MRLRPLTIALAFGLLPGAASAADLLQAYQLARTGDPQLSAAESSRLATKEGAVQARAAMLPQIGGEARLTRSRNDSSSTQTASTNPPVVSTNEGTSDTTARNLGVNVRQMVYDRANFTRLEGQRALSASSDFQLESAGDGLITRTSQAYFNVLIAIETLAAAQAQETALRRQFDFAQKRLDVGLAPITDVHEARSQFENARANVILTRNALEDAYQALAEITGVPVRDLKGLPDDFKPSLPDAHDADGWVATAIEQNPALRATDYEVRAADADIETARAGYWPTVYATGGVSDQRTTGTFDSTGGSAPIDSSGRGPQLGVVLSVPIFSGGAVSSRVRQAIANRDVRADQMEQQKRAIVRNTRNAYQALVAGISEIEARRLGLVAARSAYEASQVGLEVGTRTVLDVLVNQQTLFNAQREYARTKYAFLQNRLLLEQSAGTLDVADVQEVNRLLTVDAEAQLKQPPPRG